MDMRARFRALVHGMDEALLGELAAELASVVEERRKRIAVEDITVERLKDPQFAAEVRAELDAVIKGIRRGDHTE